MDAAIDKLFPWLRTLLMVNNLWFRGQAVIVLRGVYIQVGYNVL